MKAGVFVFVLLLAVSSAYGEQGFVRGVKAYEKVCAECRQEVIDRSMGGEKYQGIISACASKNDPDKIFYSYWVVPVSIAVKYTGRAVSEVRKAAQKDGGGCSSEPGLGACLQRPR